MAKITGPSLATRIDAIEVPTERRGHLGGSVLGHPCKRYLWYSFRWAYKNAVNARVHRIFRLGDAIEDLIVADLHRIGLTVMNSQLKVTGYKRHGGGSIDGMIGDKLFEAKSMNVSNFNKLKKGVQKAFPLYYSQMQYYMGRLGLDQALFVSMNKNTQELYTEDVDFDEEEFDRLCQVEQAVIDAPSDESFERIGFNRSWHECRYCSAADVCFDESLAEVSCRTCSNITVEEGGQWFCHKHNEFRGMKQQLEACKHYG